MLDRRFSSQLLWYFIIAALVCVTLFLFVPHSGGRAIVKALSGTFIASAIAMIIFSWSMKPIYFWPLYLLNTIFYLSVITALMVNLAPQEVEFSRISHAVWIDAAPYFKSTLLMCVGLSGLRYFFRKPKLEK